MIWAQVIIATLVGAVCGLWIGLEVGRMIYNRKMDELRGEVAELQSWLSKYAR